MQNSIILILDFLELVLYNYYINVYCILGDSIVKIKIKSNAKRMLLKFIDFCIIMFSSGISYLVLKRMINFDVSVTSFIIFSMISSFLSVLSLKIFGAYRVIWKFVESKELIHCAFALTCGWVIGGITYIILGYRLNYPETHIIFTYAISVFMIILSRIVYKGQYSWLRRARSVEKTIRTLVVGAGYAGHMIISEMLQPECDYLPVVVVDDDVEKTGRYIHGIKVEGTVLDIPYLAKKHNISKIIIAIPSCSAKERKKILEYCKQTGCEINILPYVHKMIAGETLLGQTKQINLEDLLGREPIKFEQDSIKKLVEGKVCMVTGGGGSIGSELSRQIASYNPELLVIVDIYENNAYEIQQELVRKYGNALNLQVRIASVRDYDKMETLFAEFKPQLVFHAAAHKHVPLMEDSPAEAIKNNIFGTHNTVVLADKYNVEKFILVSTDKAVNPTNVMGATKRCCEMIIEYMKQKKTSDTEYVAVRFGNVLGSNGSVVPLFEEQIRNGGPVTVTHPDIIRYFMTIPEATSLILQAASFANGGEIFVLDMGEPVKILNLAENVIRMNGKRPYEDIKIEFTGLRPGEKLFEELLMSEEGLKKTENNKIFIGKQTEVDMDRFGLQLEILREYAMNNDCDNCVDMLSQIVTTFKRNVVKA